MDPFTEGQDAAYAGQELDDNPYKGDGEEDQKANWDEGYMSIHELQEDEEDDQPPAATSFNML